MGLLIAVVTRRADGHNIVRGELRMDLTVRNENQQVRIEGLDVEQALLCKFLASLGPRAASEQLRALCSEDATVNANNSRTSARTLEDGRNISSVGVRGLQEANNCTAGQEPMQNQSGCLPCPPLQYSADGLQCVSCDAGQGPMHNRSGCMPCGPMWDNSRVCDMCNDDPTGELAAVGSGCGALAGIGCDTDLRGSVWLPASSQAPLGSQVSALCPVACGECVPTGANSRTYRLSGTGTTSTGSLASASAETNFVLPSTKLGQTMYVCHLPFSRISRLISFLNSPL